MIAEVYHLLGAEMTEKFLMVFAGTTIHVPSTRDINEADRNLAIYDTLSKAKSPLESRNLCEVMCKQYNLRRFEVRELYRLTRKMLNEGKTMLEADARTSQHKKSKLRVKRKKERRM